MNSQTSLIISVIIALLILGGSVAFVHFRTVSPNNAAPVTQAEQVTIDAVMASCTGKDQCIIVDTKCSFCCDYVAINSKSEVLYNQLFDKTCKNYSGTYCQCHDLSSYPSCVNGTCQMVKWSENKPLKTPPAPGRAVAAPVPVSTPGPAQVTAPVTTQAPVPTVAPPALGEPDAAPQTGPLTPSPETDDLFAPLPDSPPVLQEDDSVHVIQP